MCDFSIVSAQPHESHQLLSGGHYRLLQEYFSSSTYNTCGYNTCRGTPNQQEIEMQNTMQNTEVSRGEYYFGLAMAWFMVLYPLSQGVSVLYFK